MLFQVQVIATNQFGSSDPSEVFRFHTSTVGEIIFIILTTTHSLSIRSFCLWQVLEVIGSCCGTEALYKFNIWKTHMFKQLIKEYLVQRLLRL